MIIIICYDCSWDSTKQCVFDTSMANHSMNNLFSISGFKEDLLDIKIIYVV